jgi:hypothetical protein
MLNSFISLSGQSNYDLANKAIGGLDNFVSLMIENNVTLSSMPPSIINFNTNNILSATKSGYNYSTFPYSQGLSPILNNDGTPILNNNCQPIYNN